MLAQVHAAQAGVVQAQSRVMRMHQVRPAAAAMHLLHQLQVMMVISQPRQPAPAVARRAVSAVLQQAL